MSIFSRTNLALSVNDPTVGESLMYDHFVVSANGGQVHQTADWVDAVQVYWDYRGLADEGYCEYIGLHGIVVC